MPGPLTISQMTSLVTLVGPELFPCVSPGNNTATNANYNVSANQIAALALISFPPTTANFVFAGPTSGGTAIPSFRGLVNADLPSETGLSIVGVAGTASASPASIVGATDQVLRIAQTGTSLSFGPINLATTAAVTGILPVSNGGIGTTLLRLDGLLLGNGSSPVGIVAATTAGFPLIAQGSASVPAYQALNLATANVTGQLPVTFGGIGTGALASHGIPVARGSAAFAVAGATTAGYPLVANGSTTDPSFQATNLASTFVTGILGVVNGGISTTTLPLNAVLLGNGTGGLLVVTATTAGQVLQSQGSTSPPSYTTVGAGTITNVTSGFGLAGGPITTSGTLSIATTNPPYGFSVPINLQLSASTASTALTITVLGNNGAAISSTNPIMIPFRDATLANGDPVWRIATGALAITVPQTATLGGTASAPLRVWITAHDTGTAPVLGVINCVVGLPAPTQIFPLAQHNLQTTIAIASTSITAGVFYASSAVSAKPFTILGYFEYANITTAGAWNGVPTQLQLFGPGIKKPGEQLQSIIVQPASMATTLAGTGALVTTSLSGVISPTSPANLVKFMVSIGVDAGTAGAANSYGTASVFRFATAVGPVMRAGVNAAGAGGQLAGAGYDNPATTAAVSYFLKAQAGSGSLLIPPVSTYVGSLTLEEIMA